MKFLSVIVLFCGVLFAQNTPIQAQVTQEIEKLDEPMYNPFIERYLVDEVKDLRVQQQQLRVEMTDKIANSKLEVSDRALSYVTSTVNNIFFILTAVASLAALFGWKSLRDLREQTKLIVQQKVEEIVQDYEKKLQDIETTMQQRSKQILQNQERINKSNQIHALWRRSQLEDNVQAKVDIYDQILSIDTQNVEALTYKADAVLDLGEKEWALNLCNQALEIDDSYAYSFWQRACVNSELENIENAISDISKAVQLSPSLINDIEDEKSFDHIKDDPRFHEFAASLPVHQ